MFENKKSRNYTFGNIEEAISNSKNVSGLDFLNQMKDGTLPAAPAVDTLAIHLNELEFGVANFDFIPEDFHYNAVGTVHGGVISTILDTAMGCSLLSTLTEEFTFTTLELKVNFMRAITVNSGKMTTKTKLIHAGRTTAVIEATLVDLHDKIFAHATSTCLIMKKM